MCRKRIFKTINLIKKDREEIHSENAQASSSHDYYAVNWAFCQHLSFIGKLSVQFLFCAVFTIRWMIWLGYFRFFAKTPNIALKQSRAQLMRMAFFSNLRMDFFSICNFTSYWQMMKFLCKNKQKKLHIKYRKVLCKIQKPDSNISQSCQESC